MLQPILKGIWQILNSDGEFSGSPDRNDSCHLQRQWRDLLSLTPAFASRKIAGLYNDN